MRCPHCRQFMPLVPPNAGKQWTPYLDKVLENQVAIYRDRGISVDDALPLLAELLGRTIPGIDARLRRLDLITDEPSKDCFYYGDSCFKPGHNHDHGG